MSPEQAQGLPVDHRSDIYSLGIVLYELIAGRVPFESDTSWTVILKHINDEPPPIDGIQPPVQQVIERVLAKDPDLRHQTCRELASDYLNAIGLVPLNRFSDSSSSYSAIQSWTCNSNTEWAGNGIRKTPCSLRSRIEADTANCRCRSDAAGTHSDSVYPLSSICLSD
jgi:serine/threonine protein kinase